MRENPFIIICLTTVLYGCLPPQLPLSKEEKALEKQLSKKFGCEVVFKHDYPTIKEGGSDGTFGIFMCDNLCNSEYSELLKICGDISKQLTPILSHKNSYKSISIGFSKAIKIDERMEREDCVKIFKFLVSNPDSLLLFKKIY
ncbi:MAG: hypothetical protein JNL70_16525 [Saprospiraceae bacterium]|nr:hypothetical protein [Saprospiraceae bacterium]